MVFSHRPLISKSSSPWTNLFITVPSTPITLIFNIFFFSSLVYILISLFAFFQFYSVVSRNCKIYYSACSLLFQFLFFFFFSLFFLLTITRCARLAAIQWSVCISNSQLFLRVSFSRTDSKLCIYHLFVWSNLNFLHIFQWITFPPSHVKSYTLFALIYYTRLLYNWSHHLCHHITYISYFVASCLFLLWNGRS